MGEYDKYRGRSWHGPQAMANDIILKRRYPGNESLAFLIVEGETDRKFYKNFVDNTKCVINVAQNKSSAIQIVEILEKSTVSGILAIVDADFDLLEDDMSYQENVLLTDVHDVEMMILKSSALEKVLGEFASEEKMSRLRSRGKDVRSVLLEHATTIGYLRLVSLRNSLSFKFEGLDFTDFLDKERLVLDQPKLFRLIISRSQRQDISEAELIASMQNIKKDAHDPWQICNGHDVIEILSVALRKAIGTGDAKDVKPEILERSLRLAFERTYFSQTQLYHNIQKWQRANEPFIILEQIMI